MADGTQVDIYEAVIADLESRILVLQSTVDSLRNVRSMAGVVAGVGAVQNSTLRQPQSVDFGHDAFFGMTIPDACKKYLSAIKKTASIATIVEAITAGGLKSAATNMKENVRSILGRHPEFVRINGEFGLAEWYPGRKTPQKRKPTEATPDNEEAIADQEASEPQKPSNVLMLPA